MMFQYLQGMNDRLCALMHGGREIRENLIAVQKLLKLGDVKQELQTSPAESAPVEVPANWPSIGKVTFKDVSLRYRPETDLVLKDLSFDVQPSHKVGVVGRTGAGKSTMCLLISRILELEKGNIEIDGIETNKVALETLRNKITVIP